MSSTDQPSTVYGAGVTRSTFWTRRRVPKASKTSAYESSLTSVSPSLSR